MADDRRLQPRVRPEGTAARRERALVVHLGTRPDEKASRCGSMRLATRWNGVERSGAVGEREGRGAARRQRPATRTERKTANLRRRKRRPLRPRRRPGRECGLRAPPPKTSAAVSSRVENVYDETKNVFPKSYIVTVERLSYRESYTG